MEKIIGIDPGKHTGVAVAVDGVLTEVFETDFWGLFDALEDHVGATVIVELPNTKHVWHKEAKAEGAIQRTGVNVGSALREAELIVSYLHRNGWKYRTQRPQGKVDKDYFKRVTGWSGRTNAHTRDAAMLCFGVKK